MDASTLASAEYWLSAIAVAKLVAAFLVAAGVVIELGGDWIARPYERVVKEARESEVTALNRETVRLSTEAETAKSEIAQANARAAEANRIAEEERLARVKLETQLASRRLTPEQVKNLSIAIQNLHLQVKALKITRLGDHEAHDYATSIAVAVNNAGIYAGMTDIGAMAPPRYGLFVTPDLKPAFDAAGITVDGLISMPEGLTPLPEIFVGLKPPAF